MQKIAYGFLLLVLFTLKTAAQVKRLECGTKAPAVKPVITEQMKARRAANRVLYSAPYPLRVFIKVFADNDGSNLAAPEADVLRQFENMRGFYSPHNICFILSGYEVIRNTDLNDMNKDEDNDRDQVEAMALTNSFTIFIHYDLYEGSTGLNGTAYDVPNHFLSLNGSAVTSTSNLSTMAHEMGHCLGLLHTFEDAYGAENRARSGSCQDCDGNGDLLCDTQADRNVDNDFINTNCVYTGSLTDDCGQALLMEERNIMTYGRRSCREFFTAGQEDRMLTYILDDHENRIAENTLALGSAILSAGLFNYAARNTINFSPGVSFMVTAAASANFSSRIITFSPGVDLKPTVGYVVARAGVYCQ